MNLIFGVVDVAYGDARGKSGAETTGEVAEILEDKYHVMETFYVTNQEKIAELLAGSVTDAIETLVATGRNVMPMADAEQAIEAEFRDFLSRDEMTKLVAGLSEGENAALGPGGSFGGAAKAGISHRKKRPNAKKNKARPAFVDTGLYQASFRAWTEE